MHKILAKKLRRKSWWNNSREIICETVEYIQPAQDKAGNFLGNSQLFKEGPVRGSWFVSGLKSAAAWCLFLLFSDLYTVALYVGPLMSGN